MSSGASLLEALFGEPGLRDALLRPRQPRLGDEIAQLVAVDPRQVRDPHQHRRIAVEVGES